MKNFGFLAGLKKRASKLNMVSDGKTPYRPLIQKIILTCIALCVTSLWLRRVYEVPVYVTDINFFDNGWVNDTTKSHLTVYLSRNYSRNNNFKKVPVYDSLVEMSRPTTGGLFIRGGCHKLKDGGFDELPADTLEMECYKIINHQLNLCEAEAYRAQEIVDTASHRILAPRKKPDKMAVVYVTRTKRQNVIFSENGNWGDSEPRCYSAGHYPYFGMNQDFQVADTLIALKQMSNRDKFIETTDIYLTTYKDSFCAVNTTLIGPDYDSPNIIKAAEDVSQIVDKIRFNTFLNKDAYNQMRKGKDSTFISKMYLLDSLIIEYYGYAEFSDRITPAPDSTSLTAIYYWDKSKLRDIFCNDLIVHAKFPYMENIQDAKIFLLSMLITMLVGILGDLLYKIGIFKIFDYKRFSWIITILAAIIGIIMIYLMYTKAHSASQEVERTMTILK